MNVVYDGPVYSRSDARIMPPNLEPRIDISRKLLDLIERWPSDDAQFQRADGQIVGGTLRLSQDGVRTIYVIKRAKWYGIVYEAEWPD